MERIKLTKVTGFKAPYNQIFNIFDYRGVFFYSNKNLDNKNSDFNLPIGIWFSDCILEKLPKRVNNLKLQLPPKERNFEIKKFTLVFAPNPNKASIIWDYKHIIIDNSFTKKPLNELFYVFFHEIGHKFYSTEKYADLYSAYMMLKTGFNISQIGEGCLNALSKYSYNRKEFIINNLMNYGT